MCVSVKSRLGRGVTLPWPVQEEVGIEVGWMDDRWMIGGWMHTWYSSKVPCIHPYMQSSILFSTKYRTLWRKVLYFVVRWPSSRCSDSAAQTANCQASATKGIDREIKKKQSPNNIQQNTLVWYNPKVLKYLDKRHLFHSVQFIFLPETWARPFPYVSWRAFTGSMSWSKFLSQCGIT